MGRGVYPKETDEVRDDWVRWYLRGDNRDQDRLVKT